ncbi:glucose-6-phosphatase catalytic subunit 1 isoform X2 [Parasteatoda tepidariorum]|uniref:glucose-6-phosphatase catalytic subunit 1 isoform X2 n=1 Tax=Parasteatoda tepidariorum TaxID=114398 RepID=UPI001C718AA3|nr:glucose-6-phosphatase catalytic subunit 1 isoform X2 [Parasteatoda tepidariorum]
MVSGELSHFLNFFFHIRNLQSEKYNSVYQGCPIGGPPTLIVWPANFLFSLIGLSFPIKIALWTMDILYEKDVHIIEYIQARLLHGERPYWWVHETQIYNTTGKTIPFLHQFPITCETGPGSPSGHSQSTASVWYVIIQTFLQKNNFSSIDRYGLISKTCWFVYFLLLTAIGTSRIFIAAHFPHQCIFGIILGWAVAVSLENINQVKCNILQYSTITAGMMASAAFVYTFLETIGTDPMWTINKAIKWCIDENYIHLDTTPLYSMMRYCGFMLGMGFGFNSSYFEKNYQLEYTIRKRLLCALLSVASCLLSEEIIFHKDSLILYYFQAFLLNMVLAYIIVAVIPTVTNAIWTIKEKNE